MSNTIFARLAQFSDSFCYQFCGDASTTLSQQDHVFIDNVSGDVEVKRVDVPNSPSPTVQTEPATPESSTGDDVDFCIGRQEPVEATEKDDGCEVLLETTAKEGGGDGPKSPVESTVKVGVSDDGSKAISKLTAVNLIKNDDRIMQQAPEEAPLKSTAADGNQNGGHKIEEVPKKAPSKLATKNCSGNDTCNKIKEATEASALQEGIDETKKTIEAPEESTSRRFQAGRWRQYRKEVQRTDAIVAESAEGTSDSSCYFEFRTSVWPTASKDEAITKGDPLDDDRVTNPSLARVVHVISRVLVSEPNCRGCTKFDPNGCTWTIDVQSSSELENSDTDNESPLDKTVAAAVASLETLSNDSGTKRLQKAKDPVEIAPSDKAGEFPIDRSCEFSIRIFDGVSSPRKKHEEPTRPTSPELTRASSPEPTRPTSPQPLRKALSLAKRSLSIQNRKRSMTKNPSGQLSMNAIKLSLSQPVVKECEEYVVTMQLKRRDKRAGRPAKGSDSVTFFGRISDCIKAELIRLELPHHLRSVNSNHKGESAKGNSSVGNSGARKFQDVYELKEELASGMFAKVHLATHRATGEKFAVKVIKREKMSSSDTALVLYEVLIQASLSDHPNIVQLHDFYEQDDFFFLVMELMTGGDLFDQIGERDGYSERDARDLCKTLLLALQHCHERNVVHCDIKPKNLMLHDKDNDTFIKLVDFGLSSRLTGPMSLTRLCGSPFYVAPEVITRKPYDQSADMWSVGAITYLLLGGSVPFMGTSLQEIFHKVAVGKFTFPSEHWSAVSHEAKNLIRGLLDPNPTKRLTATEALESPWIKMNEKSLSSRDLWKSGKALKSFNSTTTNRSFNAKTQFKKAVFTVQCAQRIKGKWDYEPGKDGAEVDESDEVFWI